MFPENDGVKKRAIKLRFPTAKPLDLPLEVGKPTYIETAQQATFLSNVRYKVRVRHH
jgi:hypothetical protein